MRCNIENCEEAGEFGLTLNEVRWPVPFLCEHHHAEALITLEV